MEVLIGAETRAVALVSVTIFPDGIYSNSPEYTRMESLSVPLPFHRLCAREHPDVE